MCCQLSDLSLVEEEEVEKLVLGFVFMRLMQVNEDAFPDIEFCYCFCAIAANIVDKPWLFILSQWR